MNKIKSLIILSLMLFVGGQMMGQSQKINGTMFLSAAFPMGDFADGDAITNTALGSATDNEGGAGIGFNVGLKWNFGVGVPGLNVMLSLDGFYNGPSSDMKEYYTDVRNTWEVTHNNVTVRSPKYFNVPAMLGVHYCFDLNPQFGIYAEGGLGGNMRFITNYTQKGNIKVVNSKDSVISDYQNAFSFAYQFGLGIKVSNSLVIGASFYDLGNAEVKGEVRSVVAGVEAPAVSFENGSIRPMMILGRIGFAF